MKICFYNHTGHVSGAERMLFCVLQSLDREAFDPVVFAPESQQFRQVCDELGIRFNAVAVLNARYTLRPDKAARFAISTVMAIKDLRDRFKAESPDLIHANTTRAAIVATLATAGLNVKISWQTQDILPKHPISTFIRLLALASRRRVSIVAVSRATADRFAGRFLRLFKLTSQISVIHNGIDTARFTPISHRRVNDFLSTVALEPSHFRIGIVGQITPRKGHLELIRWLADSLKTHLSHARILVVGSPIFNNDADYLLKLKAEAHRLGIERQVLFLGLRDVPTVMPSLNVLVLNSKNEPFGLVIPEAMACGTPVVAAAVDGVPELIEHGESGLLFEAGDAKGFLSHLNLLAENSSAVEKLTLGGLERARSRFDQIIFQTKMNEHYRTILQMGPAPAKACGAQVSAAFLNRGAIK